MDGRVKLTSWHGSSITREGMTAIAAFEDAMEHHGHHGYISSNEKALDDALHSLPWSERTPFGTMYAVDAFSREYMTKVAFDSSTQLTIELGDDGEYWMTDIYTNAPMETATKYLGTSNEYDMAFHREEDSATITPVRFNRRNMWSISDAIEIFQSGIEDNKNIGDLGSRFFEDLVIYSGNLYDMRDDINVEQFVGARVSLCIWSASEFENDRQRGASYKTATHIDLTIGEDGRFWMTGLHAAPPSENRVVLYVDDEVWYEYRRR